MRRSGNSSILCMERQTRQKTATEMKTILTLLLLLSVAGCNAQHNNMREPECGGYRSRNYDTEPLENVKGELTSIYCEFYDEYHSEKPALVTYDIRLDDTSFNGSISRERGYDSYKFNVKKSAKTVQALSKALKESGLLRFNGWNVYVNGLPPITEFFISASFTTGEKFFMEFNGGRMPDGFMDAVQVFNEAVCKAADFTPDKCEKSKPYVNPYHGEHHFHYSKDGKQQSFTFNIKSTGGEENAEVISDGDFGYLHARCNAHKVSSRYFVSILGYYDDSKITTPKPNSLAGILDNINGTLYLEPLQAAPDLPDRSKIKKEE